ncbi:MAG TPA: glutathione S-transferase family protein [Kamptonema sp.]|nr:glutathione S-transferase family protein [Kamptonema sp.]
MLKLYHQPISFNSRRVWITLLEKGIEFELVEVKLDGDQFKPEFLAINPFHHIPVLVDDDFNVVESLAILDYIDAKYPTPTMLPKDAKEKAIVRMVQMVTVNELGPAVMVLAPKLLGLSGGDPEKTEVALQKISTVLKFFENLLGDRPFFGSESLTLAEVVAGTVIPWLQKGAVSFSDYPKLNAWCDRLIARPTWKATEPTPEAIQWIKSRITARMAN